MTNSWENKPKISIRQSMEVKHNLKKNPKKLDLSWMSEVNPCDSAQDQEEIRSLIQTLRRI